MNSHSKKLITIVGPTAVGKTEVAILLAKHFGTEIISADSRQIYRELTIGTAKPSALELNEVKHHFIDSHSIKEEYNAAQFGDEALALANELFKRHDQLVVCGGSGLYLKALLEGFDEIPEIPDEIRDRIIEEYEEKGLPWLQERMKALDPEQFDKMDQQNPQRLMRAMEVKLSTGQSIGSFQKKAKRVLPFSVIKVGLELDRDELFKRIDHRMDKMIETGLFDEARQLQEFKNHQALQTVGYQEIFGFMEGLYDKDEAVRLLKRNSRRYAKRQLTWFKRDKEIIWFSPRQLNEIIDFIST